jgi:CO/xanthine dehydrogenase Mo-binding subunit
MIVRDVPDTANTPNSGTSTASRQTLFTGEAARRAATQLMEALGEAGSLAALEGRRFLAEFTSPTDPMGSPKPNPVSHVAYGYAAQVVILAEHKRVQRVVAAHDVGHVVNPKSCEGQVEGGVVMGLGYAFTEDFPMDGGYPTLNYGKLGLWRATEAPPIEVRLIEKGTEDQFAFGAKGIGDRHHSTAPAAAHAVMRVDGKLRTRLPMEDTPYR